MFKDDRHGVLASRRGQVAVELEGSEGMSNFSLVKGEARRKCRGFRGLGFAIRF